MRTLFIYILGTILTLFPGHSIALEKEETDTNVIGHVTDKDTKEHLPYVTVQLKGTTIGTTTDGTGHYFLKNLPIVGSPAETWRKTFLMSLITGAPDLALCCSKSDDPYTQEEYLDDIYAYVFGPTIEGKALLDWQREAQITWLNTIIETSEVKSGKKGGSSIGINGAQEVGYVESVQRDLMRFLSAAPESVKMQLRGQMPIQGIGFQQRVNAEFPSMAPLYYEFLLKTQKQLQRSRNTGDASTQAHYAYLLKVIRDAMKVE